MDSRTLRILAANPQASQEIGLDAARLVGQPLASVYAPDHASGVLAACADLLAGRGQRAQVDSWRRRSDGQLFPVRDCLGLWEDGPQGRCLVISSQALRGHGEMCLNLKAQEALEESDQRYRSLFEDSVDPIFLCDDKGRLFKCNRLAQAFLGMDDKELFGTPLAQLEVESPPRLDGSFFATVSEEASNIIETRWRAATGAVPVEIRCRAVTYRGRRAVRVSVRDITNRQRAESERIWRERLQAAIHTAGAACHELNQPLQAVMSRTELAMDLLDPGDTALIKALDLIHQDLERMGQITRQLMHITDYRTRDYLGTRRILDLERSSQDAASQPALFDPTTEKAS